VATVQSVRAAPLVPMHFGRRLPILDSYILKELAGPFGFSLAAFLLFWIVNIFFLAADYIINAHAPAILLLRFLIFRVPQCTPYAFPFACLFGTLLAFGRLAADNEITALRTSGVPFLRICATPLILGLAMFGLSYFINDTVAPKAVELSTRTFYQIVYHTAELPILPQFFRKDDATGNVFYVGNVEEDHKTMDDVMIFEQATNSPFRRVINAQRAIVVGQTLHLVDARVTEFKPTGEFNGGIKSKSVDIGLPLGETIDQFLNTAQNDAYTMNSKQLSGQIHAMQVTGQGGQALDVLKITLAQKLALPFASMIAVVIALPLAATFGKKGRTLGIALSILLFFVYYLIMSAFAALGKNEALNPYLASWIPNLILGVAGAIMFRRVER
jgi:lipopolysaccharide export system permease protein